MIFRRHFWCIFVIIFLFGCGNTGDIEKVIKKDLNDPDSFKLKMVLVSKDATRACIIWNAKNQLGGYGNWRITGLRRTDGAWEVSDAGISDAGMDPRLCTEDFYKLRDELRALEVQLLKREDLPNSIRAIIYKTRDLKYEDPEIMKKTLVTMRGFAKSF